MLVGIGHTHYWLDQGEPVPAVQREGNMAGTDAGQATHGKIISFLAMLQWTWRFLGE